MCRCFQILDRSFWFETPSTSLQRSCSHEYSKSKIPTIRKACRASFDGFSDEDFSKKIQELALQFQLSDGGNVRGYETEVDSDSRNDHSTVNFVEKQGQFSHSKLDYAKPWWPETFQENDEIVLASIERKANSVELPFSLRIIKRKLQLQEGFKAAGSGRSARRRTWSGRTRTPRRGRRSRSECRRAPGRRAVRLSSRATAGRWSPGSPLQ